MLTIAEIIIQILFIEADTDIKKKVLFLFIGKNKIIILDTSKNRRVILIFINIVKAQIGIIF
jgi:hypothetical protein